MFLIDTEEIQCPSHPSAKCLAYSPTKLALSLGINAHFLIDILQLELVYLEVRT